MGVRTKKTVVGLTLAIGALGGGVLVGSGLSPVAAAQEAIDDVETKTTWIGEALSSLVDDGTIDQAQADAVEERLTDTRAERHGAFHKDDEGDAKRERSFGNRGDLGNRFSQFTAPLGDLFDMTDEELRAAVLNGDSLADLAEANDVAIEDVVDTLTAPLFERIDAAVDAERIDADRAAEMKASTAEKVTAAVEGEIGDYFRDSGRRSFGKFGKHRGHGGFDHGGDADAEDDGGA